MSQSRKETKKQQSVSQEKKLKNNNQLVKKLKSNTQSRKETKKQQLVRENYDTWDIVYTY